MTAEPLLVGIDVGGTRIKAVAVTADDPAWTSSTLEPSLRASISRATPHPLEPVLADVVADVLAETLAAAGGVAPRPQALGVCLLGLVDDASGTGVLSANAGWRNLPAASLLSQRLGMDVTVSHDGRSGLAAEVAFGAGRGASNVMYLGVGTGVTGPLMIDGRLLSAGGFAGEIGHVIVAPDGPVCGCGMRGCLEAVASAGAVARDYTERTGVAATARDVADLVIQGDPIAVDIWDTAVVYLATALAHVVTITGVEHIVIGGGLANSWDLIAQPLAREIDRRLSFQRRPLLVHAHLGDHAGALGALLLAREAQR